MLSPRRGFTLVEVLVVLAIGIVLAAAFLPSLLGGADRARIDESAASLAALGAAIGNMHDDVARYPGRLSDLAAPIGAAGTDLCGTAYGATTTSWNGPYVERSIPTTGLPLPIGTARDQLAYTAGPPILHIQVDDVGHADARALDAEIDADADSLAGAVRWGPVSATGVVVLSWVRPVRAC